MNGQPIGVQRLVRRHLAPLLLVTACACTPGAGIEPPARGAERGMPVASTPSATVSAPATLGSAAVAPTASPSTLAPSAAPAAPAAPPGPLAPVAPDTSEPGH